MPKNASQKLFSSSRSPKLLATQHLGSDATSSAANTPPQSPPDSTPKPENGEHIVINTMQNSNNVFPDNRVDNTIDNSVTTISHTAGTQIINYLSGCNKCSSEPSHKVHFMVPYSRNEGFIGISQTLVWMEKKTKKGRANHHRVALWGMGGVGKTQDVLECIYHYQSSQQLSVFWVHAGSQLRFEKDYRKLARLAGLLVSDDVKQDIRPIVKGWLEGPESGDWILVLDNADNQLDFFKSVHTDAIEGNGLADFIPHGSKGTVIITTRDREVAARLVEAGNILDKTVMDSTHARQLFIQKYPMATDYAGNEDNSISLLLQELQYLPLAISQVTAYLCQNTLLLPSEYLNLFRAAKDSQKNLLSKPFNDIRRECQSETVLTTFSITFRQLQEQSPLASSLLQLIACIDNQCIPHELIASSVKEDKLRLAEALSRLIAFGLLSTTGQGKRGEKNDYEMHSLVHVSINSFISVPKKDAAVKLMAMALRRMYPKIKHKSYDTWILYLSHVSALANHMEEGSEDKTHIYSFMSLLLLLTGNTFAGKEKAEQAVNLGADILGPEDPNTLIAISNLAWAYENEGHFKKAEELEIQVMEVRKRVLGPEHPDTLTTISNLASTYWNQGRLKEAEDLEIQIMEAQKRVLGPEHPDTLTTISNLASTYQDQGRLKEAEDLGIQVLEARKRVLGPEHPDTFTTINNLASIYWDQGRLKEAEDLGIQIMEAQKRVLGPAHPDTLTTISNLASTYWNQGRLKEAEDLEIQVMEVRKKVLGPEHPDTLTTISNLASTYQDQGHLKEAEELWIQVLEAWNRVLGPEHPDTLLNINSLATTYQDQGRLKEAEELWIQVLEARKRALGPGHPHTLITTRLLTAVYDKQGLLNDAKMLGIEVMDALKRVSRWSLFKSST